MRTETLRRIHVIGGPGSGKTTLARRLAVHLDIPPFDLDEIGYVGGAGPARPLTERLADVRAIAARPAWITEGIYLWWVDDLLRTADVIVWLDPPWHVAARRIVLRHLRAGLAGVNRHPGLHKLLRFVQSSRSYYIDPSVEEVVVPNDDGAATRARTARELALYADKLVRCSSPADVALFLHSIG